MIILFEKNGAKKTIRTINCARDRMVVLVRNQFYSKMIVKTEYTKKMTQPENPSKYFPRFYFAIN